MGLRSRWIKPVLDLGAPPAHSRIVDTKFLAVDFETTGTDPRKDRIVSIGWVPLTTQRIDLSGAGYELIRGVEVGNSATLHHLTDDDLATGKELSTVVGEFLSALQGRVLLAHFAALESKFLEAACRQLYGRRPALQVADTFTMERRHMEKMGTYPRGEDLRLARVRQRYGLPDYLNHNAQSDALACAELFLALTAQSRATKIKHLR